MPFTVYSLLLTVYRSLFTVYPPNLRLRLGGGQAVYRLLFTVHSLLFTVYCSPFTVHHGDPFKKKNPCISAGAFIKYCVPNYFSALISSSFMRT